MPPDTKTMSPAYDLRMGAVPVTATTLRTTLSLEQARAFYEQALKRQGWTIEEVPWFQRALKEREALQEDVKQHPEKAKDPQVAAVLSGDNVQRFQAAARQQLYAVRNVEHLLIGFVPAGGKTLLAITRWEGNRENPLGAQASGQPAGTQAPLWPAANPCCDGQQVPAALRQAPSSIPSYPNGRLISSGATPTTMQRVTVFEMYLTEDSAADVRTYYHQHMAYNGWTEVPSPAGVSRQQLEQALGPQGGQWNVERLTFRDDQGTCSIVITEFQGQMDAAVPGLMAALPQTTAGTPNAKERTMIGVNYVESPWLGRQGSPKVQKGAEQ